MFCIRTDYFRFLNFDILSYAREVHPRNCILHLRGIIKGYQDGSTLRCHQPNLARGRGGKPPRLIRPKGKGNHDRPVSNIRHVTYD